MSIAALKVRGPFKGPSGYEHHGLAVKFCGAAFRPGHLLMEFPVRGEGRVRQQRLWSPLVEVQLFQVRLERSTVELMGPGMTTVPTVGAVADSREDVRDVYRERHSPRVHVIGQIPVVFVRETGPKRMLQPVSPGEEECCPWHIVLSRPAYLPVCQVEEEEPPQKGRVGRHTRPEFRISSDTMVSRYAGA